MSWEFISKSEPKARKKYTCDQCDCGIYPGEKHLKFVGKFEGEIMDCRQHLDCSAAAHMINSLRDEYGEDGVTLFASDLEPEEKQLLLQQFPHVAMRLGIDPPEPNIKDLFLTEEQIARFNKWKERFSA